jgi:DNA helicase-2/ATP-dependent DNA helicase PcrA
VRLNADQAAAVACVDKHLVIVAGPGTGKTRTLTVRLANLVQRHGVAPESVLALTFTNKAAAEMAERLAGLLGEAVASRMTVTTFHALGGQLLREFGDKLGLPAGFAIVDDEDRRLLLRRVAPQLGEANLTTLSDWISRAKQQLFPPAAAELAGETGHAAAYAAYQSSLGQAGLVDFDDLVMLPATLLAEHPAVAATLHARYRWIAVDEYQDVNFAQVELLRRLAAGGANVCVIGDPDQAIYGFRGADHRFFRQFAADFPGAVTVHLRQSYRSPQSLLDAAAQVISHNADAASRQLVSDFTAAVKLTVLPAATDRAEAETVVHRIEQMVGGTSMFSRDSGRVDDDANDAAPARSFADFAVLHRLGSQRAGLVEAFDRSGIPYQVVGQAGLAEHREIRGALALLRLAERPALALTTLLGAGQGSLPVPALNWLGDQIIARGVADGLAQTTTGRPLTPSQRRRVAGLAAAWADLPASGPVATRVEQALAAWLAWQGETATPSQKARAAQLQALAATYGDDLAGFLTALTLQRDGDGFDPRADRVAILTLHAAKGLEFPVVFMVGCEEGLLPYLPPNKPVDVGEERRLFYVGMTRAREQLILTHAQRRVLYGQTLQAPVSRFVDEIEAALKEVQAPAPRRAKPVKEDPQLPLF